MNKLISYVGFAIKSNSIIKGVDDLTKSKKKVWLILKSEGLGVNSKEKLEAFTKSKNIETIALREDVFKTLNLAGVKVVGLTDKNLANAIKNVI